MLVALLADVRIDAAVAQRGPVYLCPKCRSLLILKKGRKVVHHFAHKPPSNCAWAKGETRAHLEAKLIVASALTERGLKAEVEFVVNTLPGDRRADVMAWSPKGQQIAFELQHTAIDLSEIERRALSYASAGIAQIWIPFLRESVWREGGPRAGGWFVERYAPRPFERWVHGFNEKRGMWMYDPVAKVFWRGSLASHQIYTEVTTWYSEGGEENSAGGFYRWSRRYKELTLNGPYKAETLLINVKAREAFATNGYNWPAARVAHLTPT